MLVYRAFVCVYNYVFVYKYLYVYVYVYVYVFVYVYVHMYEFVYVYVCNGFNKQQFTKLLCLAVQDNVFMFNNKLFKRVDGVAMSSPLGPLFANFFLGFLEQEYFTECNNVISLHFMYVILTTHLFCLIIEVILNSL